MAMAYATACFYLQLTFLNLISIGLAAIRARPRPASLPAIRSAVKVAERAQDLGEGMVTGCGDTPSNLSLAKASRLWRSVNTGRLFDPGRVPQRASIVVNTQGTSLDLSRCSDT
jgi:hypothetical protein